MQKRAKIALAGVFLATLGFAVCPKAGELGNGRNAAAQGARERASTNAVSGKATTNAVGFELVPLPLQLPNRPNIESWYYPREFGEIPRSPRAPFLAPRGVTNVALGKQVTCSTNRAPGFDLWKITDGEKGDRDEQVVYLPRGLQWVQIDLGQAYPIYAILIWHEFGNYYVFHDLILQASDDPNFRQDVRTFFNNDRDNSAGLGVGTDPEYVEFYEGKLIDAKGTSARYLRFYSNGCNRLHINRYVEIEVYALPSNPGSTSAANKK